MDKVVIRSVQYADLKLDVKVPMDLDAAMLERKIKDDYFDLLEDHVRMGFYFLQAYAVIDFRRLRREGDQTRKYKGFTDFCMKVGKCSRRKIYMCMHVLDAFGKRDSDGCLLPELREEALGRTFSVLAEIAEFPDLLGDLPRGATVREARQVVKNKKNQNQQKDPKTGDLITCDLKLSPGGLDVSDWPVKDRSAYEPHLGALTALVKALNSQGYDLSLSFKRRRRREPKQNQSQIGCKSKKEEKQMSLSDYEKEDGNSEMLCRG